MPPGRFNGMILEALPISSEAFITVAVIRCRIMLLTTKCGYKQSYKNHNSDVVKAKILRPRPRLSSSLKVQAKTWTFLAKAFVYMAEHKLRYTVCITT